MPFHALVLALATPPLAGILLMVLYGAWPIGLSLVSSILAPAWFIGAAPAFLAGRLDARLASRGWNAHLRLGVVAALAFTFGAAILAPFYVSGRIRGAEPLFIPLALGLSAVLTLGLNIVLARLFIPHDRLVSERNENHER